MKNNSSNLKTLLSSDQIKVELENIATLLNSDYKGEEIFVLVVLKGALIFASDLIRLLEPKLSLDFIRVKSYQGTSATNKALTFYCEKDLSEFKGKHVLLIEDIVDKGRTIQFLLKSLEKHKPKSLKVCTLLYKNSALSLLEKIDYSGFKLKDNDFVVGYGMDYNESFRNLPYLALYRER